MYTFLKYPTLRSVLLTINNSNSLQTELKFAQRNVTFHQFSTNTQCNYMHKNLVTFTILDLFVNNLLSTKLFFFDTIFKQIFSFV